MYGLCLIVLLSCKSQFSSFIASQIIHIIHCTCSSGFLENQFLLIADYMNNKAYFG